MNENEIKDILEELHLVRPEILQPKAKKLFTAIMIIADERDKYKDNWNELKRWLYENHCLYVREVARNSTYQRVLNKMEEIEEGGIE